MRWRWANRYHDGVMAEENGIIHSRAIHDPEIVAWLAAGNTPDDEPVKVLPPHAISVQTIGGAIYTWYRFERVGDQLPWHDHTFAHHSVLLKGKILVRRDGITDRIMSELFDSVLFPAGQFHELMAIEPDSMCLQIQFGE